MNNSTDQHLNTIYRSILTCIFVGFADALISLIFNIMYRSAGAEFSQAIINVSYLIFGTFFLFLIVGLIYATLHILSRKGDVIFISVFALLTLVGLFAIGSASLANTDVENLRYRGMLRGLVLLDGISATALVPFFYNSYKFQEYIV